MIDGPRIERFILEICIIISEILNDSETMGAGCGVGKSVIRLQDDDDDDGTKRLAF